MCGRYTLDKPLKIIEKHFAPLIIKCEHSKRYNIAPGQNIPVITLQNNQRELRLMRWGLIPSWAKSIKTDKILINAVCPGAVDTPMLAAEATAFGLDIADGKKLWASAAANNSLASAEDVASAILFLVSNNAKHIHGISLPVDGGSIA